MFRDLLSPEIALVVRWVGLMLVGIAFRFLINRYKKKGLGKEAYRKLRLYRFYEGGLVFCGLLTVFTTLNFAFEKVQTTFDMSLPTVGFGLAAILLYGFALGDFLSTKKALRLGARELNPIGRLVIAKFGVNKLPILSVTVMSLVLVFAWGRTVVSGQYSMLVVFFGILVSNTFQIRKWEKKAIEREVAKVKIDKEE